MIPAGQLTGAVLAGGESRRMGQDKATLVVNGRPLWQHQGAMLRSAGAGVVGIVRRPGQAELRLSKDLIVWHDTLSGIGALAGLHAALHACPTGWLAVAAVDLPRLEAGWFLWLATHCSPDRGAIARHPDGHFEPLAAIYPQAATAEVNRRGAGRDFSLQSLAESLIAQQLLASVPLPADRLAQVENWNTPAEAARQVR